VRWDFLISQRREYTFEAMNHSESSDNREDVAAWIMQWKAMSKALQRESASDCETRFQRSLNALLGDIPSSWLRDQSSQQSGLIAFHAALALRGAK
jgi:meiotically up-regulated gene 157 (Mug157) protein